MNEKELNYLDFKRNIHIFCDNGDLDSLSNIKYSNVCNGYGKTGLHYACENGNFEMVKQIIKAGHADVNITDSRYRTALHYAAANGSKQIVQFLVETCKADYKSKDENGKNALDFAFENEHKDIINYFLSHTEIKDYPIGRCACFTSNLELLKKLNKSHKLDYEYLFMLASKYNQSKVINYFLKDTIFGKLLL